MRQPRDARCGDPHRAVGDGEVEDLGARVQDLQRTVRGASASLDDAGDPGCATGLGMGVAGSAGRDTPSR